MARALNTAEQALLVKTFPELSWIKANDWESLNQYADWTTAWDDQADDGCALQLGTRAGRIDIRRDARSYYGKDNVDNILDPSEERWA